MKQINRSSRGKRGLKAKPRSALSKVRKGVRSIFLTKRRQKHLIVDEVGTVPSADTISASISPSNSSSTSEGALPFDDVEGAIVTDDSFSITETEEESMSFNSSAMSIADDFAADRSSGTALLSTIEQKNSLEAYEDSGVMDSLMDDRFLDDVSLVSSCRTFDSSKCGDDEADHYADSKPVQIEGSVFDDNASSGRPARTMLVASDALLKYQSLIGMLNLNTSTDTTPFADISSVDIQDDMLDQEESAASVSLLEPVHAEDTTPSNTSMNGSTGYVVDASSMIDASEAIATEASKQQPSQLDGREPEADGMGDEDEEDRQEEEACEDASIISALTEDHPQSNAFRMARPEHTTAAGAEKEKDSGRAAVEQKSMMLSNKETDFTATILESISEDDSSSVPFNDAPEEQAEEPYEEDNTTIGLESSTADKVGVVDEQTPQVFRRLTNAKEPTKPVDDATPKRTTAIQKRTSRNARRFEHTMNLSSRNLIKRPLEVAFDATRDAVERTLSTDLGLLPSPSPRAASPLSSTSSKLGQVVRRSKLPVASVDYRSLGGRTPSELTMHTVLTRASRIKDLNVRKANYYLNGSVAVVQQYGANGVSKPRYFLSGRFATMLIAAIVVASVACALCYKNMAIRAMEDELPAIVAAAVEEKMQERSFEPDMMFVRDVLEQSQQQDETFMTEDDVLTEAVLAEETMSETFETSEAIGSLNMFWWVV